MHLLFQAICRYLTKNIQVMVEKFSQENVWTSFLTSRNFEFLRVRIELVITPDNIECAYTGISIIDAKKLKSLIQIKKIMLFLMIRELLLI